MAVVVVLSIYSGKPNPQWQLDKSQECRLRELLNSCKEVAEERLGTRLGYRGFMILGEPGSDLAEPIEVFHGVVKQPEGVLLDRDRRLERWLLETAGEALPQKLHDLVLRELEK